MFFGTFRCGESADRVYEGWGRTLRFACPFFGALAEVSTELSMKPLNDNWRATSDEEGLVGLHTVQRWT
jgi:hypothetical protein